MKKLKSFLALSLAFAMVFGVTVFAEESRNTGDVKAEETVNKGSRIVTENIDIVSVYEEYQEEELQKIKDDAANAINDPKKNTKVPEVPSNRTIKKGAKPELLFTMVFKPKPGASFNKGEAVDITFTPPGDVFDFANFVYQAVHKLDGGGEEILNVVQSGNDVTIKGSHGFSPYTFFKLELVGDESPSPTSSPRDKGSDPTDAPTTPTTPESPQTGETMPVAVVIALIALVCVAVVGTKKVIARR